MKRTVELKANRFKELENQMFNYDVEYFRNQIKEKDVTDLLKFIRSGVDSYGEKYVEDVENLRRAVRGQEHTDIHTANILSCIIFYKNWVEKLINWFGDFND